MSDLVRHSTRQPDFICIGAQRAATTWLFECLKSHDQVFVPEQKEVHFFDENYDRGWHWYEEHFAEAKPSNVIGDISPSYLNVHEVPQRIQTDCPRAKLFVVLREPVSRAISSYELLGHRFKEKSFEEACQPGKYIVELGLYAKHLRRFYEYFPREQLRVFLFDDIRTDPNAMLAELCDYLNVTNISVPPQDKQINSAAFPAAQRLLDSLGLGCLVSLAKATPFSSNLRNLATRFRQKKRRSIDRKRFHQLFRSDILELQDLIERDLSAWLM